MHEQTENTGGHSFKKLMEYIVHKNLTISEIIAFLKEYNNEEINKLTFDDFIKLNIVFDYEPYLLHDNFSEYCNEITRHCTDRKIVKYFIDFLDSNLNVTIKNIIACYNLVIKKEG